MSGKDSIFSFTQNNAVSGQSHACTACSQDSNLWITFSSLISSFSTPYLHTARWMFVSSKFQIYMFLFLLPLTVIYNSLWNSSYLLGGKMANKSGSLILTRDNKSTKHKKEHPKNIFRYHIEDNFECMPRAKDYKKDQLVCTCNMYAEWFGGSSRLDTITTYIHTTTHMDGS